jgi:hypothetical protein
MSSPDLPDLPDVPEDVPAKPQTDPKARDEKHATGEKQAQENRENESPA